MAVIDGVGHGPTAAEAAAAAATVITAAKELPLVDILARCHADLLRTRGAVISLARLEEDGRTLHFAGIGNVEGRIFSDGRVESLVPPRGILGAATPRMRAFRYTLPEHWLLFLHSDGVSRRAHPPAGLWKREDETDLKRVSDEMLGQWARPTDDATILLARAGGP